MCLSSEWTQPPYNDKNPLYPFLIHKKPKHSQLPGRLDFLSSMTSLCSGPAHDR